MMNYSFPMLKSEISLGIGLFGCGILIQQIISQRINNAKRKKNFEITFEKIYTCDNQNDNLITINDYNYSSNEFDKTNVKQLEHIKSHLDPEKNENKFCDNTVIIQKTDSQSNTEQVISNDNNIISVKDKINRFVNRVTTKTKSEIEFDYNNSNQVVIKMICVDDEEFCFELERKIIDLITSISNKDLNILIETEGGAIRYAISICNCLYIYKKLNPTNKIKIYIPKYAYSIGTYIALMADELYLNDYALLSPVDIQLNLAIEHFSSNDYIKYGEDEDRKTTDISKNSLMMSIVAKKYMNLSTFIFNKFIFNNCNKYNPKIRKQIVNKFIHTEYPHVITFDKDEIKNIGIDIVGNVPKEIIDIYNEIIEQ